MRVVIAALGILLASTSAQAQAFDSLQVPAGALKVLQIPVDTNRPFSMLRAIRVLHALPRKDPPPVVADFERLVDALDLVDRELARINNGPLTLSMASGAERDALRDVLEAIGLRLRERQRTFTVEPIDGRSAADLRALLARGGIDAAGVQRRLHAGDAVAIAAPRVELPLPLRFDEWRLILGSTLQQHRLFSAVIRSRDASLLYYGLTAMNSDTRAWLTRTPALLEPLRQHAAAVAAFGGAFRVDRNNRVLMPGGADADELWEDLVDEKVTDPAKFAEALFQRDAGRLAYFVDALWALDEPHAKFALGLWMSDRRLRRDHLRALYGVFAQTDESWSIENAPFARPSYDLALLLSLVRVNGDGLLAAPAYRKLWEHAAEGIELPDPDDRRLREPAADGVADAAFLATRLSGKPTQERRLIIERIAFAQRCFEKAADAELPDVLVALRAYGRFPSAMLALERIGISSPAVFAATARHAARLESLDPPAAVPLLTQFQGSLALLERFARTGAIEQPAIERLAAALVAVPFDDNEYRGGIAQWFRASVVPALPAGRAGTVDARVLDSLVDRVPKEGATFSWEGEALVLDTARLRRELEALRARQGGNSLDAILAVYSRAFALSAAPLTLDGVKSDAAGLAADAAKLVPPRPWPDAPDAVPELKKVIDRAVKDLANIRKPQDVTKAPRAVRPVVDALDYLLGETFVGLAYAASFGDTGRKTASSVDIWHRHSFGFTKAGSAARQAPWHRPTRAAAGGGGDAVIGSLTGIDLALSDTRLRRLSTDGLPETPRMNDNDRETMTQTVALLNPRMLTDAQGAEIAAAIRRGSDRVQKAAGDAGALDAIAVEARLTPIRRGLTDWTARHERTAVTELFSLGDLFRLGGGQATAIHSWGTAHEAFTGCYCIRFPDDAAWELTAGRPDTGQAAARIPELNLRVAALLAELRVPATLFPHVMAFATQDYVDTVPLVHPDDWMAFVGRAAALSRERVEDYVAAVIASGPVRLADEPGAR